MSSELAAERLARRDPEDAGVGIFFNAHHAPIGAFATLTLGSKGASGGYGVEIGGPANEDLYIGVESAEEEGKYSALPFFKGGDLGSNLQEFDVESLSGVGRAPKVAAFPNEMIQRHLGAAVDEWAAGDLVLRIYSAAGPVPDPDSATIEALQLGLAPAILAEVTIDNRLSSRARKAFFGLGGASRQGALRTIRGDGMVGLAQGPVSIASRDDGVYAGIGFQPEAILEPSHSSNLDFMLGRTGLLVGSVEPGAVRTFRFSIAFFREGIATDGLRCRYLYRRYFESPETVHRLTLSSAGAIREEAEAFDAKLAELPPARRLMLAHAIRSYFGSTQALETEDGKPLWVVNEGEYRMMNTLDLTADQAFFELDRNPWTVRNSLEFHLARHAYEDDLGLAFCHDVGVANTFAEPENSAYEQAGLTGCFSYMSAEELVNWTLCACMVGLRHDRSWLGTQAGALQKCLESLIRRDHIEPSRRTGVVSRDSLRCAGGSEITTYDSLDASLGQARGNVYLAVKTWAAHVLLARAFEAVYSQELAEAAHTQARLAADTIANSADEKGILPAILGESVPAQVIPAVEGLAYLAYMEEREALDENGVYGSLLGALRKHLVQVLESGNCHFSDGGWRLSSTSRNSWLSKIYLCQYVAQTVFGLPEDVTADEAHLGWLMRPDNAYFAWSDQMLEGQAVGSRYYPRGVTAWLWLPQSIREVNHS